MVSDLGDPFLLDPFPEATSFSSSPLTSLLLCDRLHTVFLPVLSTECWCFLSLYLEPSFLFPLSLDTCTLSLMASHTFPDFSEVPTSALPPGPCPRLRPLYPEFSQTSLPGCPIGISHSACTKLSSYSCRNPLCPVFPLTHSTHSYYTSIGYIGKNARFCNKQRNHCYN